MRGFGVLILARSHRRSPTPDPRPTTEMYPLWPVQVMGLKLLADGETRARVRFFQPEALRGEPVTGPIEVDVDVHELRKFEQSLRGALQARAGSLHVEGLLRGIEAHEARGGLDDEALAAASGLAPGTLQEFRAENSDLLEGSGGSGSGRSPTRRKRSRA